MHGRDEELRRYARSVGAFPTARPEKWRIVLFEHLAGARDNPAGRSVGSTLTLDYRQRAVDLLWYGRGSAKAGRHADAFVAFEAAYSLATAVDNERLVANAVADIAKACLALGLLTHDSPSRARAQEVLPVLRRDYPATAKELEEVLAAECPAPTVTSSEIERAHAALEAMLAKQEAERAAEAERKAEAEKIAAMREALKTQSPNLSDQEMPWLS